MKCANVRDWPAETCDNVQQLTLIKSEHGQDKSDGNTPYASHGDLIGELEPGELHNYLTAHVYDRAGRMAITHNEFFFPKKRPSNNRVGCVALVFHTPN